MAGIVVAGGFVVGVAAPGSCSPAVTVGGVSSGESSGRPGLLVVADGFVDADGAGVDGGNRGTDGEMTVDGSADEAGGSGFGSGDGG